MAAGLTGQRGEAARSRAVESSSRACARAQIPNQIGSVTTVTAITMTTVSAIDSHVLQILQLVMYLKLDFLNTYFSFFKRRNIRQKKRHCCINYIVFDND